jgi:large subunit ribosomal protein L15
VKPGFEGGQMPLQRRLPKRGFTNIFRVENQAVNLGVIAAAFKAGDTVSPETLIEKGMIKARKGPVKVLGAGEISIPLTIRANAFSSSAVSKIEAAGGKAEVI